MENQNETKIHLIVNYESGLKKYIPAVISAPNVDGVETEYPVAIWEIYSDWLAGRKGDANEEIATIETLFGKCVMTVNWSKVVDLDILPFDFDPMTTHRVELTGGIFVDGPAPEGEPTPEQPVEGTARMLNSPHNKWYCSHAVSSPLGYSPR